jgi:hypothetical protein
MRVQDTRLPLHEAELGFLRRLGKKHPSWKARFSIVKVLG